MTTENAPPGAPRAPRAPREEREPPRTIGRYDVERLLGQGGMGRVWLARDSVLGRNVAIKVLRDDLALPPSVRDELITRMRHEAQAAAAVSHPNIVTLYDMGEDDAMGLYLVFEYVPGPKADGPESLRDRLREGGPLPLNDVARLARELGSALTFAHAAGVIHRDIKPENILFSRTGAKIADFGIARIPDSTITRVNTVLGTPAYTSPEALSKADFGPASDQFAFAATLYEATTGTRAFGGDDPIVTAGKVSSEPPPPLDASLGSALVVRQLNAALSKGVAKEVVDRFASCIDLGETVARAIERPNDTGGPSIDALLAAASAANLDSSGPASDRIEIERTPLSSRAGLERAVRRTSDRPMLTPYGDRPSIVIRKQTHQLQNVVAAIALVVIIVLIVMGKKQRDRASLQDAASASPTASVAPSAPHPSSLPHAAVVPPGRRTATPRPPISTSAGSTPSSTSGTASGSALVSPPPVPADAAVHPPDRF